MTDETMKLWLERPLPNHLGNELKSLLNNEDGCLMVPGAHDPMAAILAKNAGFKALYLSGAALTASLGLPDLGLLTMDELVQRTRAIVRAVPLPLIVDGDTGYGEALNVMRLVRELEEAGAAGVQLEDQVMPKKCGHLNGKSLVPAKDMCEKIAAAKRAAGSLQIIARTDAAATEGLEAAVDRAKQYVEAGADIIFPEAMTKTEDFKVFADALSVPVLGNMTEFGRTPQMSAAEFAALGVKLAIWPVSSLRISAKATEDFYRLLKTEESAKNAVKEMQTRAELYETIHYFGYEALDQKIQKTLLTDEMK